MKKFLAILLSALMMLTLFAGCSDKGSDDDKKDNKKEDTSASEKADNEKDNDANDNADADVEDEVVGVSRGKIKNNVYTNAFAGITFTAPDDFVFATDEEIAEMNGISVSDLNAADYAALLAENSDLYDMNVINADASSATDISVIFEDLDASGASSATEEEYLSNAFGADSIEISTGKLGSEWYTIADIETDTDLICKAYVQKIGVYMVTIVIITDDEAALSEIEAMFS